MKNLLIYLNSSGDFDNETKLLVKIQIDNSLDLGWAREDIMLVTNFEYEYNGIKSIVIDGSAYCNIRPHSTKTTGVDYLMKHGMIKSGILYWVHDFDAFQSTPITEDEARKELGEHDLGLSDYGRMSRWSTGSMFFTETAKEIFGWMTERIYTRRTDEERALHKLTMYNIHNVQHRVQKINISYNFQTNNLRSIYAMAVKPLKVLHFHPFVDQKGVNTLDYFLRGKNKISTVLASERLIKIFNNYGIS